MHLTAMCFPGCRRKEEEEEETLIMKMPPIRGHGLGPVSGPLHEANTSRPSQFLPVKKKKLASDPILKTLNNI